MTTTPKPPSCTHAKKVRRWSADASGATSLALTRSRRRSTPSTPTRPRPRRPTGARSSSSSNASGQQPPDDGGSGLPSPASTARQQTPAKGTAGRADDGVVCQTRQEPSVTSSATEWPICTVTAASRSRPMKCGCLPRMRTQRGLVTDEPDVTERIVESALPVLPSRSLMVLNAVEVSVRACVDSAFDESVRVGDEDFDLTVVVPSSAGCQTRCSLAHAETRAPPRSPDRQRSRDSRVPWHRAHACTT